MCPLPLNPVQLFTGLSNYKLVFRRTALKGSTERKVLEKGYMGKRL